MASLLVVIFVVEVAVVAVNSIGAKSINDLVRSYYGTHGEQRGWRPFG